MRVNARLDETTQQQLDYLTQATGESVSHVVRESVAHYYVQVKSQRQPSRLLALAAAGQWRSSRTDMSATTSNVRSGVLEALKAKYPQHFGIERASAVPASTPDVARPKSKSKSKSKPSAA